MTVLIESVIVCYRKSIDIYGTVLDWGTIEVIIDKNMISVKRTVDK